MSQQLVKWKTVEQTKDVLPWGTFFARPHKHYKGVNTLGFKDNNFFIMISNYFDGSEAPIQSLRRCPSKTSTKQKTTRMPFDSMPTKMLPIPAAVSTYNHHMNGVDIADQLRSYYSSTRRMRRGAWKALLYLFLLGKFYINRSTIKSGILRLWSAT